MSDHILIHNAKAEPAATEASDIEALQRNEDIAVLHMSNDVDLDTIIDALPRIQAIQIDFPAFTDGRGFSVAKLLRTRHGYKGQLIAAGPLIPDQYAFALQCGFDAVQIDQVQLARQPESHWQAALDQFGLTYQRGYAVAAGPSQNVIDARLSAHG